MPFTIGANKGSIPDGTYKAQLIGVQDGIATKFGTARRWSWLLDINGEGKELEQLTSENNAPGTVSYKQLEALIGRKPVVGETLEDPTGKTVMLTIKAKDNGWPGVDSVTPIVEPVQVEAGIPR